MFERRERRHLRLVHPMAQDVGDVERSPRVPRRVVHASSVAETAVAQLTGIGSPTLVNHLNDDTDDLRRDHGKR